VENDLIPEIERVRLILPLFFAAQVRDRRAEEAWLLRFGSLVEVSPTKGMMPRFTMPAKNPCRYSFCSIEKLSLDNWCCSIAVLHLRRDLPRQATGEARRKTDERLQAFPLAEIGLIAQAWSL
jgi:hypothetical protein